MTAPTLPDADTIEHLDWQPEVPCDASKLSPNDHLGPQRCDQQAAWRIWTEADARERVAVLLFCTDHKVAAERHFARCAVCRSWLTLHVEPI